MANSGRSMYQHGHDKNHVFQYSNQLSFKQNIPLPPVSTSFIISRKLSAYLVGVNDHEVMIEPYYDEVRRFATADRALALQKLSRFMLGFRNPSDPCDYLLEFYARHGWKIEETDTEVFKPE